MAKPDLAYGSRAAESDRTKQMIRGALGQYCCLSGEICHAFSIVEAKSSEGTIADAEN